MKCVKVLLEAGCDVNKQDSEGRTALICASQAFNPNCVKMLIQNGADLNIQDTDYRTATMHTLHDETDYFQFVKQLKSTMKIESTNFDDRNGQIECLDLLIKSGADLNIVDEYGCTALDLAELHGNVFGIELLSAAMTRKYFNQRDDDDCTGT